jgi:hypothetical protein
MEVGCQRHALAALLSGKTLGTHCTGGWVGPTADGTVEKNFDPPTRIRSPNRPPSSESQKQCKENWTQNSKKNSIIVKQIYARAG